MSSHIAQLLVTLFVVVFSISSTVRTFLLMFLPVVIVAVWLCCRKGEEQQSIKKETWRGATALRRKMEKDGGKRKRDRSLRQV